MLSTFSKTFTILENKDKTTTCTLIVNIKILNFNNGFSKINILLMS